jgi:hypothetical protein
MTNLEQLPLLYDGDSYILDLQLVNEGNIRLLRIVRYDGNKNVVGVEEKFHDLDTLCKRAVINQIQRRHKGKSVRV